MSDYRKFISVVVFNRLQYNERCSVSAWDLHFEHVLRKTCPIDPSLGEIPSVYNEETIWSHTICIKRNMIIYGAVWPCYSICLLSMRLYGRTWTPYRFIWLILLLNFMKNMMQPKLEQLKEISSIASPELSSILHILCLTELCVYRLLRCTAQSPTFNCVSVSFKRHRWPWIELFAAFNSMVKDDISS